MASINVWAGMQIVRDRRGKNAKVVVEFRAPELKFTPDERVVAKRLADGLTQTFRRYLSEGKWLDGHPMPAAPQSTIDRRRLRMEQIARGGQAKRVSGKVGSGFSPTSVPLVASRAVVRAHEMRNNIARRYQTKRMGRTDPSAATSGLGVAGLESGTTARSIAVQMVGKGARIFVADIRGKLDKTGSSAWMRVLRKMGGLKRLTNVFDDPLVATSMRLAWRELFTLNGRRLGGELAKTAQLLKGIAKDAEKLAEDDPDYQP